MYDVARGSCAALMGGPVKGVLPATLNLESLDEYARTLDVELVRKRGASLASDINATKVSLSLHRQTS